MTEFFKTFKNQSKKFEQFSSCESVGDRIKLVHQALASKEEFRNVTGLFINKGPKPDNKDRSKKLRDIGNKLYQTKKFKEAIKSYTESMYEVTIDAEGKSKEIALALGNRSAVYFQSGEYVKCLEDIEAALMFGYPEEMQYKLMDRQIRVKCQFLVL